MGIDPAFGTSNFGTAKMYSESETLINNILTILFGKPGAYPTLPNLGMDVPKLLLNLYDDIDEETLKNELVENCSSFKDVVQNGEFDVIKTTLKDKHANEVPSILFKVPTKIKNVSKSLIIGISSSNKQIAYNFAWLDE